MRNSIILCLVLFGLLNTNIRAQSLHFSTTRLNTASMSLGVSDGTVAADTFGNIYYLEILCSNDTVIDGTTYKGDDIHLIKKDKNGDIVFIKQVANRKIKNVFDQTVRCDRSGNCFVLMHCEADTFTWFSKLYSRTKNLGRAQLVWSYILSDGTLSFTDTAAVTGPGYIRFYGYNVANNGYLYCQGVSGGWFSFMGKPATGLFWVELRTNKTRRVIAPDVVKSDPYLWAYSYTDFRIFGGSDNYIYGQAPIFDSLRFKNITVKNNTKNINEKVLLYRMDVNGNVMNSLIVEKFVDAKQSIQFWDTSFYLNIISGDTLRMGGTKTPPLINSNGKPTNYLVSISRDMKVRWVRRIQDLGGSSGSFSVFHAPLTDSKMAFGLMVSQTDTLIYEESKEVFKNLRTCDDVDGSFCFIGYDIFGNFKFVQSEKLLRFKGKTVFASKLAQHNISAYPFMLVGGVCDNGWSSLFVYDTRWDSVFFFYSKARFQYKNYNYFVPLRKPIIEKVLAPRRCFQQLDLTVKVSETGTEQLKCRIDISGDPQFPTSEKYFFTISEARTSEVLSCITAKAYQKMYYRVTVYSDFDTAGIWLDSVTPAAESPSVGVPFLEQTESPRFTFSSVVGNFECIAAQEQGFLISTSGSPDTNDIRLKSNGVKKLYSGSYTLPDNQDSALVWAYAKAGGKWYFSPQYLVISRQEILNLSITKSPHPDYVNALRNKGIFLDKKGQIHLLTYGNFKPFVFNKITYASGNSAQTNNYFHLQDMDIGGNPSRIRELSSCSRANFVNPCFRIQREESQKQGKNLELYCTGTTKAVVMAFSTDELNLLQNFNYGLLVFDSTNAIVRAINSPVDFPSIQKYTNGQYFGIKRFTTPKTIGSYSFSAGMYAFILDSNLNIVRYSLIATFPKGPSWDPAIQDIYVGNDGRIQVVIPVDTVVRFSNGTITRRAKIDEAYNLFRNSTAYTILDSNLNILKCNQLFSWDVYANVEEYFFDRSGNLVMAAHSGDTIYYAGSQLIAKDYFKGIVVIDTNGTSIRGHFNSDVTWSGKIHAYLSPKGNYVVDDEYNSTTCFAAKKLGVTKAGLFLYSYILDPVNLQETYFTRNQAHYAYGIFYPYARYSTLGRSLITGTYRDSIRYFDYYYGGILGKTNTFYTNIGSYDGLELDPPTVDSVVAKRFVIKSAYRAAFDENVSKKGFYIADNPEFINSTMVLDTVAGSGIVTKIGFPSKKLYLRAFCVGKRGTAVSETTELVHPDSGLMRMDLTTDFGGQIKLTTVTKTGKSALINPRAIVIAQYCSDSTFSDYVMTDTIGRMTSQDFWHVLTELWCGKKVFVRYGFLLHNYAWLSPPASVVTKCNPLEHVWTNSIKGDQSLGYLIYTTSNGNIFLHIQNIAAGKTITYQGKTIKNTFNFTADAMFKLNSNGKLDTFIVTAPFDYLATYDNRLMIHKRVSDSFNYANLKWKRKSTTQDYLFMEIDSNFKVLFSYYHYWNKSPYGLILVPRGDVEGNYIATYVGKDSCYLNGKLLRYSDTSYGIIYKIRNYQYEQIFSLQNSYGITPWITRENGIERITLNAGIKYDTRIPGQGFFRPGMSYSDVYQYFLVLDSSGNLVQKQSILGPKNGNLGYIRQTQDAVVFVTSQSDPSLLLNNIAPGAVDKSQALVKCYIMRYTPLDGRIKYRKLADDIALNANALNTRTNKLFYTLNSYTGSKIPNPNIALNDQVYLDEKVAAGNRIYNGSTRISEFYVEFDTSLKITQSFPFGVETKTPWAVISPSAYADDSCILGSALNSTTFREIINGYVPPSTTNTKESFLYKFGRKCKSPIYSGAAKTLAIANGIFTTKVPLLLDTGEILKCRFEYFLDSARTKKLLTRTYQLTGPTTACFDTVDFSADTMKAVYLRTWISNTCDSLNTGESQQTISRINQVKNPDRLAIRLVPNPFANNVYTLHGEAVRWTVYDMQGRELLSSSLSSMLDLSDLPNGLYVITAEKDNRRFSEMMLKVDNE